MQDFIRQFPMQSLETSEELSAIFAQPNFKKEFLTDEVAKNIETIFNDTIKGATPKE